ncbi:phosphotransferase [Lutimaribacter marinistellae]|uniref:Phosphotransferase n=1 Tax=Lutimaribacter marinistellae TaxID=1820329 RepID=A0ABV7TH80_9RHOB
MNRSVRQALALWDLEGAEARLIAQRENAVWRIDHAGKSYALRFHRPGYRSDAELASELDWMAMLARSGLIVPRPVPRSDGGFIGRSEEHRVSLLTWLDGKPIGEVGRLAAGLNPRALSRAVGEEMARMHDLTDDWTPPQGFVRPDWRAVGLIGDDPLWGRFWEHPHLTSIQRDMFLRARKAAGRALERMDLDAGLIHADLLAENVIEHEGRIAFIDFDDAAIGYRDFELATFLLKFLDRDYYADMRAGLLEGYSARRRVQPEHLDLMLLLRALSYPGWIATRLDEPGGPARSDRAIQTALALSETYLKGRT